MLFRKRMPRSCDYCAHGAKLNNEAQEFLCAKRGVVSGLKACRKFSYDPYKRVPPKAKTSDFSKYDNEDYSL